jgi:hypothetical protein
MNVTPHVTQTIGQCPQFLYICALKEAKEVTIFFN